MDIDGLVEFVAVHGGRCFSGWPTEILVTYLRWHLRNGTLVYVSNDGGRVLGLMTVTRVNEADLGKHWTFDAAGDSLVVENAVAIRPGVLTTMIRRVQGEWPEWRRLKIFARRSKKDWEKHLYSPQLIDRLIRYET
jgi:hypothetical protein